ncbi:MAG: heme lyase CcmF/NrfE family subunit [Parvularcula sp.]|nr:heme lyase CcmF/NrfE family subunit [Parvularcula sp.]
MTHVGTSLLALAFLSSLVAAGAGLRPHGRGRSLALAGAGATAAMVAVLGAFAVLTAAYLSTDLSLLNVFLNSHSLKPAVYKFSGVWGNHEGSLLLWLLILSGFGAVMGLDRRGDPELRRLGIGMQGLLLASFLLFAILTSNPFEPYPADWPTPPDGQGLNPLLQDPGLAVHPPTLYLGYVGLSAVFSFTLAGLLRGDVGREWARIVRPYLLFAWSALTLGIGLGAFWAYYELGWGGFWFWDPVENASLMPWLAATALLHCALVVERRDVLKPWCAALAILAFGFSLLGAFLVRSGIVTSVHAFANDPQRGVVLLLITFVFVTAAFGLFAWRAPRLAKPGSFAPVSREGALVINNFLISVALFTVFLGTFWPTVIEVATGTRISVGPPYYNLMAAPVVTGMAAALAFGLLVPWKGESRKAWRKPFFIVLAIGSAAALVTAALSGGFSLAVLGLFAAAAVFAAVIADLGRQIGGYSADFGAMFRRLRGVPPRRRGAWWAHLGFGLLILGATASSVYLSETRAVISPGESTTIRGLTLTYEGRQVRAGRNYIEEIERIVVSRGSERLDVLTPSRRYYPAADQVTSEIAIRRLGLGNLYIATGGAGNEANEARLVRAYVHPLIHLLWGGVALIGIGGLLSLRGRTAQKAAARHEPSPVPQASPAEGVS